MSFDTLSQHMMLPLIMPEPMMIDMSISSTGMMLIMMISPMIGAADRRVPAIVMEAPACRSCR